MEHVTAKTTTAREKPESSGKLIRLNVFLPGWITGGGGADETFKALSGSWNSDPFKGAMAA